MDRTRKHPSSRLGLVGLAIVVAIIVGSQSAVLAASPRHSSQTARARQSSTADVGTLEATLHDPGKTPGDDFGYETAVSGDVAVVGAPQRGNLPGAAYIYVEGAHGWPTKPTVTLDDPAATDGDDFGFAVAVSRKTVVVGALNTDGAQGAAYIYSEGAHGWPTEPTVTLQDPEATDEDGFGQSVTVSGKTLVVGAYQTDAANGAAYVYEEGPDGWPTTPTLSLGHPMDRGEFGNGLAVLGDTIAVGAYMTDGDSGAAYLYVKGESGWPTTPTTTISDPAATSGDYFPGDIALSKTTLVLGDNEADGADGSAYIYTNGPSGWSSTPTATLLAPASSVSQFGASVATSGDKVIVTSSHASVLGYVYVESSGAWLTTPKGTLAGLSAYGFVSMSGSTAVIGDYGVHKLKGMAQIFEM